MCLTPRCDAAASNFDNVIAHLNKINSWEFEAQKRGALDVESDATLYQIFTNDWDWEEVRYSGRAPTPKWLSGLGDAATRNYPLNTAGGTIGLDRSGGGGTYIAENGEIAGANFEREPHFFAGLARAC